MKRGDAQRLSWSRQVEARQGLDFQAPGQISGLFFHLLFLFYLVFLVAMGTFLNSHIYGAKNLVPRGGDMDLGQTNLPRRCSERTAPACQTGLSREKNEPDPE